MAIAVVMDSSRRPVRLFRTYTVHKHGVLDDPYHIMLKRRGDEIGMIVVFGE